VKFWFKFVSRYFAEIDSGIDVNAVSNFNKNFNTFLGEIFEKLILDLLSQRKLVMFDFDRIGKWWWKDKEIDVIALNERKKEVLFVECKWKSNVNALKVVKELQEKAKYVDWYKDKRKESFAVFAKSFSKKITQFNDKKVYCFDLGDVEKKD